MKRIEIYKRSLHNKLNSVQHPLDIVGYDMITGSLRFPLGFFRHGGKWDFNIYIDETISFFSILFAEVRSWE